MKKIFTLCSICTLSIISLKSNAQFSENFDSGLSSPSGDCWQLNQVGWTNVADSPLPVKLNNFQGSKNKNNVLLQWNVNINEITGTFEIERSTDGKNFETVAIIMGTEKAGNETYNYREVNESSNVYYRLTMIDKSDVINYSRVLMFSSAKYRQNITYNRK